MFWNHLRQEHGGSERDSGLPQATQRGKGFNEVWNPGQTDSQVQDSRFLVLAQKWGVGSLPILPPPAWALRGPLKWPQSWPSNAAHSPQGHHGLEGNLVFFLGGHTTRGVSLGHGHSTRTQGTEHPPAEGAGAGGASVDIESWPWEGVGTLQSAGQATGPGPTAGECRQPLQRYWPLLGSDPSPVPGTEKAFSNSFFE